MEEFDKAWREQAAAGVCDTIGGAEYRRLSADWVKAGKPEPNAFIQRHSVGE